MDRGARRATVHKVAKTDTTEATETTEQVHMHFEVLCLSCVCIFPSLISGILSWPAPQQKPRFKEAAELRGRQRVGCQSRETAFLFLNLENTRAGEREKKRDSDELLK